MSRSGRKGKGLAVTWDHPAPAPAGLCGQTGHRWGGKPEPPWGGQGRELGLRAGWGWGEPAGRGPGWGEVLPHGLPAEPVTLWSETETRRMRQGLGPGVWLMAHAAQRGTVPGPRSLGHWVQHTPQGASDRTLSPKVRSREGCPARPREVLSGAASGQGPWSKGSGRLSAGGQLRPAWLRRARRLKGGREGGGIEGPCFTREDTVPSASCSRP